MPDLVQKTILKAGNGEQFYYLNSALTIRKTDAGAFPFEEMEPIRVPAAHSRLLWSPHMSFYLTLANSSVKEHGKRKPIPL